jgi:hypothetical protein
LGDRDEAAKQQRLAVAILAEQDVDARREPVTAILKKRDPRPLEGLENEITVDVFLERLSSASSRSRRIRSTSRKVEFAGFWSSAFAAARERTSSATLIITAANPDNSRFAPLKAASADGRKEVEVQ